MDSIDEALIEWIDSGVIRYASLSRKVGKPMSTIHMRVKRLEKSGIISRYKGDIDWKKAGYGITAFILINIDVDLLKKLKKSQDKLLKELTGIPFVKEGYIITGDADLIVKVIAEDTAQLKQILLDHIDSREGVVKTKTMIVLG